MHQDGNTEPDKVYVIPRGTQCIAYRRSSDEFGRPTIEKKYHTVQKDNRFYQPLLTPQQYIKNPYGFPGNTFTVQLVLQGYIVFTDRTKSDQRFFIAAPESVVEIRGE